MAWPNPYFSAPVGSSEPINDPSMGKVAYNYDMASWDALLKAKMDLARNFTHGPSDPYGPPEESPPGYWPGGAVREEDWGELQARPVAPRAVDIYAIPPEEYGPPVELPPGAAMVAPELARSPATAPRMRRGFVARKRRR